MRTYTDATISLPAIATLDDVGGMITSHRFVRCELNGPAVLLPDGTIRFDGCSWHVDSWAIFHGPLVGVISVIDCEFQGCRFNAVGFLADAETVAHAQRETRQG